MNIYRKINRKRIQFDFVVNDTQNEYAFESEIRELGGKIFRIPRYTIANHAYYKKKWIQLIGSHPEWNIVHSHYLTPVVAYLPVIKLYNRAVILHSHTSGSVSTIKSQIQVLLRYPIRKMDVHCFACSPGAANWMFGNKKTYIINNSIDAEKFVFNNAVRNRMRCDLHLNGAFVVGHVGRFEKVKNHSFLLDVFYAIQKKKPNAVLLLIGEGELKCEIIKKVETMGLKDKVIFTGVRSDISDLLQAMDVFVFPSLYEGLGIALIEAQASGLPCYTSANVVAKEAKITNLLDYILLQNSAEYWAEIILSGKVNTKRTDRYEEIVKAGYEIHDSSRWIEKFYLDLLRTKTILKKLPEFSDEFLRN